MRNSRDGTAEDGLHCRDSFLLGVIRDVAGLTSERNKVSVSTLATTRTDVYLYLPGFPPLVHVEEKALESELRTAINELTEKFCSTLPHYHQELQFIVGIAIAGNHVSFGKLSLGGGGGWQPLHTFDVNRLEQRLACIQVAVNVGRWCLHALAPSSELISPVSHQLGRLLSSTRSDITLLSEGVVVKRYKTLTPEQFRWLNLFYTTIAVSGDDSVGRIRFLEWAIKCSVKSEESLELRLRPLGVVATSRRPRDLCELRAALRCVLLCLQSLHEKEWVHLDLRWSNIVFMSPENWTVIDAEYARPFGSPLPVSVHNDPHATVADAAADFYMLGCMMRDHERLFVDDGSARKLRDSLLACRYSAQNSRSFLEFTFFEGF